MRVLPPLAMVIAIGCLGALREGNAQQPTPAPAPAAAGNLIANGSFENAFRRTNPWSGINQGNFLQGLTGTVRVLTQSGTIGDTAMPLSVGVADMNADGKLDLVTSDVIGYFRVYFNQGTPTEPKFDDGELIPVFLTRALAQNYQSVELGRYRAQRISVGNFAKSGKNDLMIGNYIGEVLWLKNEGSPTAPDFRQPKSRSAIAIPTTEDSTRRWGNVFAPAAWDWNGDGRFDLLLGEGSYSANAIHLLINQGAANAPRFNEKNHHFLAFGDGREQLTPAVVDYNNDGKMDLLVSDRSGKIGLFLNTYDKWKPGDEIKFSSYIPIQGQAGKDLTIGGITTVAVADLNNDNLFDLIIGKTNGRIAVAYNKGTPTEPKFELPVELKGDVATPPVQIPSGWEVDFGIIRGNFYGYITTVMAEPEDPSKVTPDMQPFTEKGLNPPSGTKALKFGYFPNTNKIIRTPLTYSGQISEDWNWNRHEWGWMNVSPANTFGILSSSSLKLIPGKTYILTFNAKGKNVQNAKAVVSYAKSMQVGESQITRGERGSATVKENVIREDRNEYFDFKPTGNWSPFKKEFKISFKDARLNEGGAAGGNLFLGAMLVPETGEFYLDDVQIVEKK